MQSSAPTIAELMAAPALLSPLPVYVDSDDRELREMLDACHNFLSLQVIDNDSKASEPVTDGVWLRESATGTLPRVDGCTQAMLTILPRITNATLVSRLNNGINVCLFRPITLEVLRCALERLREVLSQHAHQAGLHRRLLPLMTSLTPRERAVLEGLRQGHALKMIASHLSLSEKTIQMYRARLLKTFNARSSIHLALVAAWWHLCLSNQFVLNVQTLPSKEILSIFKTARPSHA